jgi:protein-tyrosine-phosphatase
VKTALGFKSHSGWSALVVLGADADGLHVIDRRRIELVKEDDAGWAKQPYHAAEHLKPEAARKLVRRGAAAARRNAAREMRAAVRRTRAAKHEIAACAVLVGEPMPAWSVDEVLAVHFRMHRAEGALFQEVLGAGARACGLELVAVPVKQLAERARTAFGPETSRVLAKVASLGKSAGPPWGKDQKEAALAAAIALREPARKISSRVSILFVCSGNTCRSVMAEALARRRFGDAARVKSAGLRPQPASDARAAIETLRLLYGIDASSHVPRSVATLELEDFDLVVAMDREVARALPPLAAGKLIEWNIDDPWEEPARYHECARRVETAVSRLHRRLSRTS